MAKQTGSKRGNGLSERLTSMLSMARSAIEQTGAEAVLIVAEQPFDWRAIRQKLGDCKLLIAYVPGQPANDTHSGGTATRHQAEPVKMPEGEAEGIYWICIDETPRPTLERISMALLEALASEQLHRGSKVIALYSGFDADEIDSLSVIRLGEHLERLTAADLRKVKTLVPLETFKAVVDLAVEIGREGREGQPVGALFVIGDTRKVLQLSRPIGYDPVRGYKRKERSIRDRRNREGIKEIAKLDGAMIVDRDGVIVAACRQLNAPASGMALPKGLGSRHWAAAAITKATNAVAVAVSQSSGAVRIFKDGRIVLRIAPLRHAMKWQDFEHEMAGPPDWIM